MQIRFDTVVYGQRAQIETVMSMLKRRQSTFVRGRNYQRQCRDLRLMALTHNILILYREAIRGQNYYLDKSKVAVTGCPRPGQKINRLLCLRRPRSADGR